MAEEKINMNIVEGDAFFAHELSLNFNPLQFVFDFKSVTPRVDPRSKERASIVMKHNVILTDPFHTKRIYELLGNVIEKYEKEFGKIERPKQLAIAEKKSRKEAAKSGGKDKTETPSYFG